MRFFQLGLLATALGLRWPGAAADFSALSFFVVVEAQGLEFAGGEGGAYGAAGFVAMTTIAKATFRGERGDVGEGVFDAVLDAPELQFAHAGGVDDERARGG